MDNNTFKILDTLSSHLGASLSINQLTKKIKEKHGTGHYPSIYDKSHELEKQDILTLESFGKSSIIKLNFKNYLLSDILSEMEIQKKLEFLSNRKDLFILFEEMEKSFSDICGIKSICSIKPIKNIKLNRIEFLFLLGKINESSEYKLLTNKILAKLNTLQKKFNIKIDSFILDKQDFISLIISDELNPLQEALLDKTAFFCPQAFWSELREISEKTIIRPSEKNTKPIEISELDLIYNLNRFGYKEFGPRIEKGQKYRIEYIIMALLLKNSIRRIESIPIILSKNNFNSNLLIFLGQKTGTSAKLLSLLKKLREILPPSEKIDYPIALLENFDLEDIQFDATGIAEKMSLYNAT